MFRPQKKNQSKDSESSESDSEAISQDGTQAINGEKADDDSEVEEINSSQFGPQTPDIKTYKGSLQSNQSGGEFYGNKELKAIFDEFMPTLEKESEKKIKDVFEKNLTEESDILIEEAKTNKTGLVTWVKNPQPETDEKIEANCVKIFNLHPKVCTRVLWELFSKVGRVKRVTLYRITNKDIETSIYLKSLNLTDEATRPHKKRAEVEYQAPNYAQNAVEVFNHLKLYEREIFVFKVIDDSLPKAKISFSRSIDTYPWLDEFFCLDYFSRSANIIRIFTNYTDLDIVIISFKITILVPDKNDLSVINDSIQMDLINYAPDVRVQFHPKLNLSREERRENKSGMNSNTIASNGIEKKKAKLLGASNEDGFIQ